MFLVFEHFIERPLGNRKMSREVVHFHFFNSNTTKLSPSILKNAFTKLTLRVDFLFHVQTVEKSQLRNILRTKKTRLECPIPKTKFTLSVTPWA